MVKPKPRIEKPERRCKERKITDIGKENPEIKTKRKENENTAIQGFYLALILFLK